jgi:hypothetical protein
VAPSVYDPFGFEAKKAMQRAIQQQQWDAFNSFMKREHETNPVSDIAADQRARQATSARQQGIGALLAKPHAWPALIYPENHWRKKGKWANDFHDGEEKEGHQYYYRLPPLPKFGGKSDPFGFHGAKIKQRPARR